jgi:uncharacterized protein (DUF1330 family)
MPKGYWIAHVDVTNSDAYRQYVEANAEAFAKFGARFIVRGGAFEVVEGTTRSRNVVIEFPDYKSAVECYRSPEYQRALSFRKSASTGDIIIIEGYEGPQPDAS